MRLTKIWTSLARTLELLQDALIASLPKIVAVMVVAIVGLLLARLAHIVTKRVVVQAGRIAGGRRVKPEFFAQTGDFAGRVIAWTLISLTVAVAAEVIGVRALSLLTAGISTHIPEIFGTIVIVLAGAILARLLRDIVVALSGAARVARSELLGRLTLYAVLGITFLIAAEQIGLNVSFLAYFMAIIAAALFFGGALAFALGAGPQIANILACYSLQKTYRVGHRIRIGKTTGRILVIGATGVTIETDEGRLYIPGKRFSERESLLLGED